jgi:hypothetical protein
LYFLAGEMAKHQPVYKSKIYCKCKVCKSWDRERTGSWECRKIECLCEERVILLVKQVKAGSNELSVTYECAEERCGFKIAAHDANCHAYVTILADMKEYMFYHTLDKCECGKDVHSVLERITAGTGVGDPTKERSINLNNELQLLFVCSTGQCSYRKSVPQIVITRREGICCVC